MTPDQLEAALQALSDDVAAFSRDRAGRTPRQFAEWFWPRADAIKADAGDDLLEAASDRVIDIVADATDAGLLGTDGDEDVPFRA